MAFTVDFEIERAFDAECAASRVFDVLSDVPRSVSHFPKVEQLVDLGDGKYKWEMEKIGIQSYYIQTVYACKYVSDREKLTVKWTPVRGQGNATVSGSWNIKALDKNRTGVKLKTKGELTLPLPGLVKLVVAPFVRAEFTRMIDQYIANLGKTFANEGKPAARGKKR